jgi:hypothetical protein
MRITAIGILASLMVTTAFANAEDDINLDWLAGSWCSEKGAKSEEHWIAREGGLMLAMSRTVTTRGTEFEFIRIEFGPGGVRYIAQPSGGPATRFDLISATPYEAIFANPEHDFPKRLRYTRRGDSLTVRIDGGTDESESREFRWRACLPVSGRFIE